MLWDLGHLTNPLREATRWQNLKKIFAWIVQEHSGEMFDALYIETNIILPIAR